MKKLSELVHDGSIEFVPQYLPPGGFTPGGYRVKAALQAAIQQVDDLLAGHEARIHALEQLPVPETLVQTFSAKMTAGTSQPIGTYDNRAAAPYLRTQGGDGLDRYVTTQAGDILILYLFSSLDQLPTSDGSVTNYAIEVSGTRYWFAGPDRDGQQTPHLSVALRVTGLPPAQHYIAVRATSTGPNARILTPDIERGRCASLVGLRVRA